jgi:hypothetical protein
MPHDEHRKGRDVNSARDFEETWSRRAAVVAGIVGLVVVGSLLGIGFADRRRELAMAPPVPCRILIDRCFEALLLLAHFHPALRSLAIPEAQKKQLLDRFKRGPLHLKIYNETVQWMEQERQLAEVHDTWQERLRVTDFLRSRFMAIDDASFIANLEKTLPGRLFLQSSIPGEISADKRFMIISYSRLITHYECFIYIDIKNVNDVRRDTETKDEGTALEPEDPSAAADDD